MLARLSTLLPFFLLSASLVAAAPLSETKASALWKRQDDALASMLSNLTSATGSTLTQASNATLNDDSEALYAGQLTDAVRPFCFPPSRLYETTTGTSPVRFADFIPLLSPFPSLHLTSCASRVENELTPDPVSEDSLDYS